VALTKPGIVRGNAVTAAAGFFVASRGDISWLLLLAMLVGLSLTIASGCTINNVIDREIDQKMDRTKDRPLAQGRVSVRAANIYGSVLGVLGVVVLLVYTNLLTAVIGALGWIFYVIVYGYWKRKSSFGTVVGSISGAVPPVVGYTAVTGRFDIGAAILFLILVVWQMPHFYAIAINRLSDYRAAGIPVLPVVKGVPAAQRQTYVYIAAFIVICPLLTVFGYTGWWYLVASVAAGVAWLVMGLRLQTGPSGIWAKKMFRFSLLVLMLISLMMSINPVPAA
jgi:protoheme IX farnesyltransferase